MDKPLISIIIPAYNTARFLDKCMLSVCAQTYKNIEIILINDGSTDETPALCDAWAAKDTRVKAIHQTNKGVSEACNTGLKVARGELIGFVDSDDWIETTMFEELHLSIRENQSDIAVCGILLDTENGQLIRRLGGGNGKIDDGKAALIKLLIDKSEKSYRWNKLYRAEIFTGITFPKGRVFEDLAVLSELYARALKVSYVNKHLYHYVQRAGSIIGAANTPEKEMDFFTANAERYTLISTFPHFSEQERKMLRIRTMKRMLSSSRAIFKMTAPEAYLSQKEEIKNTMRALYRADFNPEKHGKYLFFNYLCTIPYLHKLR